MMDFLHNNWVSLIATLIATLSAIGTTYQYFDKKKWERRWKEFEVYHKLIEKLNNVDGQAGLHEQIVAVYELEYFKRYYPLTLRILEIQKSNWQKQGGANALMIEEMELAMGNIKKNSNKRRCILVKPKI